MIILIYESMMILLSTVNNLRSHAFFNIQLNKMRFTKYNSVIKLNYSLLMKKRMDVLN